MSEFTSGPWVVRDDGTVRSMDFNSNQMGDWQGCVVCSVESGHGGRDHAKGESEANARLIAAAPELLEALKMVAMRAALDFSDKQIVQIQAAIAKAEGK